MIFDTEPGDHSSYLLLAVMDGQGGVEWSLKKGRGKGIIVKGNE